MDNRSRQAGAEDQLTVEVSEAMLRRCVDALNMRLIDKRCQGSVSVDDVAYAFGEMLRDRGARPASQMRAVES